VEDDRNRVLAPPFVARAARWGIVAWAGIGLLVLAYFGFRYVLYPVRIIFPPLVVALIMVYLLNPIVSGLERRGIRRGWGSLMVYLVFLAVVGTGLSFLVPLLVDQVAEFGNAAPRIFGQVSAGVSDFFAQFGVQVSPSAPAEQSVLDFFYGLVSLTGPILNVILVFVLGPILAFYLLVDLPKVRRGIQALIPTRRRDEVRHVGRKIGQAIGSFFRGQLLVALFVGIVSSIGLWFVGLPFWALVGLISGLFNLIPLIGPIIGTLLAVLVATTTDTSGGVLALDPGLPLALGSAIALLVVQQIDNHILSPNIVGRTVRLHPVTVMLGLLAGATLLGLWGMLLAVPVMASVKILMLHVWDTRGTWPPSPEEPAASRPSPPPAPAPQGPASPEAPPRPAGVMGWLQGLGRPRRGPAPPAPADRERSEPAEPARPRAGPG
jgi:predicted PurR-regulated permease PerM